MTACTTAERISRLIDLTIYRQLIATTSIGHFSLFPDILYNYNSLNKLNNSVEGPYLQLSCMYTWTTVHAVETHSATQSLDTRLYTVCHSDCEHISLWVMTCILCDGKVHNRERWVTKGKKHHWESMKPSWNFPHSCNCDVQCSGIISGLVLVPHNTLLIDLTVCMPSDSAFFFLPYFWDCKVVSVVTKWNEMRTNLGLSTTNQNEWDYSYYLTDCSWYFPERCHCCGRKGQGGLK